MGVLWLQPIECQSWQDLYELSKNSIDDVVLKGLTGSIESCAGSIVFLRRDDPTPCAILNVLFSWKNSCDSKREASPKCIAKCINRVFPK